MKITFKINRLVLIIGGCFNNFTFFNKIVTLYNLDYYVKIFFYIVPCLLAYYAYDTLQAISIPVALDPIYLLNSLNVLAF
jgi:hypothetical protein